MFKRYMGQALKPMAEEATSDAIRSLQQVCSLWSTAEIPSFIPAGKVIKKIAERCADMLGRPVEFVLRAKMLPTKDLEQIHTEVMSYLEPIAKSSDDTKRRYIREIQALTFFHDLLLLRGFETEYPDICPPELPMLSENLAELMEILYLCSDEKADPARVLVRMISRKLAVNPAGRFS